MERMDKLALCQKLQTSLFEFQRVLEVNQDFQAIRRLSAQVQYYVGILDEMERQENARD